MSNSPSSLENIDDAIKTSNPFSIKFVDQHHIWGASFPDVPEINAYVSDAVFTAIEQVSNNKIPSVGIIITGDKGLGKTQIISRIRHRLQSEGNAFFVYIGNYGDLNCIKSEFLQTLTSSLKRIGVEEVTQWQELAANMLFTAIGNRPCSVKDLANGKFAATVNKDPKTTEKWANGICKKTPQLNNPYLVKAILWTLSENHAPYAISWLSGQELTQSKADELGLPNNLQKTELATFKTTCEILALIANYNNLVFCFDELDDPSCNDYGFTRAQVVASLAKDLRNLIGKCVLLMALYPKTLKDQIQNFGGEGEGLGAAYDRTADKILDLEHLNSETSVALVSRWLKDFYASKELVPPNSLYPFDESEIRGIGKEKPTARAILRWCSENWKISGKIIPINPVEAVFKNELQSVSDSIDQYMEDNSVVGTALFRAFKALIGQEIESIKVINVEWIDNSNIPKTKKVDQGYLHLKIIAQENGKDVKIGVAAILQEGGQFIGAALKRLIDYKKFDFTRGCLVRSHTISRGAKVAQEHKNTLLKKQGGEWALLQKEDIKPLIAISLILGNLENYELSEAQVYEYIIEKRLVIDNPLVKEILSDPSGQEPSDLVDSDEPISTSSGMDTIDDLGL